MSDRSVHVIKRQVFELEIDSRDKAGHVQEQFKEYYYTSILPMISRVLDEFAQHEVVRRDELVLDLGDIFPGDSPDKIAERVARQLREILVSSGAVQAVKEKAAQGEEHTGRKRTGHKERHADLSPGSLLELFDHFLITGSYPWWVPQSSGLEITDIIQVLIAKEPQKLSELIRRHSLSPGARKRLCGQLPDDVLSELMPIVYSSFNGGGFPALIRELLQAGKKLKGSYTHYRQLVWESLLLFFSSGSTISQTSKSSTGIHLIDSVVATIAKSQEEYAGLLSSMFSVAESPGVLRPLIEKLKAEKERFIIDKNRTGHKEHAQPGLEQSAKEDSKTAQAEKEWYIENAGLVIFTPYLEMFFSRTGLMEKQEFTSRENQERAIHLLQYAASGQEKVPEHHLALNKLLCGIEIHEPVNRFIELDKAEKEEADKLVKAVIRNWPALKDTSMKAFREAFLLRKAIITHDDLTWLVRVERKSYDILFDRIPWSVSKIKLPWNEEPIQVQW